MDQPLQCRGGWGGEGGERRGSFAYPCGWDPHTP